MFDYFELIIREHSEKKLSFEENLMELRLALSRFNCDNPLVVPRHVFSQLEVLGYLEAVPELRQCLLVQEDMPISYKIDGDEFKSMVEFLMQEEPRPERRGPWPISHKKGVRKGDNRKLRRW